MNIIIRIWLLITCLALGIFYAEVKFVNDKLKERNSNIKITSSFKGKIRTALGSIALCACPILHIFVIYVSLFAHEEIITRVIQKVEQELDKKE